MRNRRAITLIATLLTVCALLAVVALRPASSAFKVKITYIGYTNDSWRAPWLGTTNAPAFAIQNLSRWPVLRSYCSWIESGPASHGRKFSQNEFLGLPDSNILRPGESEVVTVPPQTNHARWAVSFAFINEGALARFRKGLLLRGQKLGLTKYKQSNYCATSDEVVP